MSRRANQPRTLCGLRSSPARIRPTWEAEIGAKTVPAICAATVRCDQVASGWGGARTWGFALYLASRDGYEDNILPSGLPAGSPETALDCARGLYLGSPTT